MTEIALEEQVARLERLVAKVPGLRVEDWLQP